MEVLCKVRVPLYQIKIEETVAIADNYTYLANELFTCTEEEIDSAKCERVEFEMKLDSSDLTMLNKCLKHNDKVINLCLDEAEKGLDIIRLKYSSFLRPEFTPNPAGQLKSGFYEVEIIPDNTTPFPIITIAGLSKPLSASNNWLGPEVDNIFGWNDYKLSEILLGNEVNSLSGTVISSLRQCRQAFYTLGEESMFLALIFAIDGLTLPHHKWNGWKHRTYISALASCGSVVKFEEILNEFDIAYTDVRNKLVHEGKGFSQLPYQANEECEKLWGIYKSVLNLVLNQDFSEVSELHVYAENLLKTTDYINSYQKVINSLDGTRVNRDGSPKVISYPSWA
ncbi:hypothetical protein BI375_23545 [Vibrio rotiferianus]|uniref:Apea-like HEPN domain-containing protein n=1 Tax=Vibrio rotiferianus TaxID=190895 RepID=A0ABX3D571_9VIBR|nr:hypothetical protein [Vibrio rotiferianus]OHY89524.1 hypothetical protein BI375_23545 [Vibrio rotiferianus]